MYYLFLFKQKLGQGQVYKFFNIYLQVKLRLITPLKLVFL